VGTEKTSREKSNSELVDPIDYNLRDLTEKGRRKVLGGGVLHLRHMAVRVEIHVGESEKVAVPMKEKKNPVYAIRVLVDYHEGGRNDFA